MADDPERIGDLLVRVAELEAVLQRIAESKTSYVGVLRGIARDALAGETTYAEKKGKGLNDG